MTDKRRPNESGESFTERRIRAASEAGAFDRLPGFGQPIPGLDEPLDENWWIRAKLRREQINALPPILEVRLEIERTLAALDDLTSERAVRKRLDRLNERIRRAHYSHIAGPVDGVREVVVDELVSAWTRRRESPDVSQNDLTDPN